MKDFFLFIIIAAVILGQDLTQDQQLLISTVILGGFLLWRLYAYFRA